MVDNNLILNPMKNLKEKLTSQLNHMLRERHIEFRFKELEKKHNEHEHEHEHQEFSDHHADDNWTY